MSGKAGNGGKTVIRVSTSDHGGEKEIQIQRRSDAPTRDHRGTVGKGKKGAGKANRPEGYRECERSAKGNGSICEAAENPLEDEVQEKMEVGYLHYHGRR